MSNIVSSQDPFRIRKALIPAAGLGTRMLPVTKGLPKELLPIGRKPIIQYAVEEAVASGIEEIVLVTGSQNSAVENYFRRDAELEQRLRDRARVDQLASLVTLASLARITVVHQSHPGGLGDAVLRARYAIGQEPFALILPDAVFCGAETATSQLMSEFRRRPGTYVATQPIEPDECLRFGVLVLDSPQPALLNGVLRVRSIVEKPLPEEAPSTYGVFGRYLLMPEIFDYLENIRPDKNHEVGLTEALALCCQENHVYAVPFEGKHYDAGDWTGYLCAFVEFALRDPEIGAGLRNSIVALLQSNPDCVRGSPLPHIMS